ncbi:ChaN family lipoprotein [candidate division WOR-3 bacterium]|nr:ChaN family lipoprotein [candidate division WOR-3 bacterium]
MLIFLAMLLNLISVGGTTIFDARGEELSFKEFVEALSTYDVIFIGEQHGVAPIHQTELAIFNDLIRSETKPVLALEMFEQDIQELLDSYLAGEISEDSFLALSRPWPNYQTDYRPLIEMAKANSIPVVAANIPRRAAAAVARADTVTTQALGIDSIYMPDILYLDSREYYERFEATMLTMSHGSPMGEMNIDALYKAQVLKDAAMAQALHPYLERKVIFVCGSFHSDYHLGIPYQLGKNHPDLRIAVVTFISADEELKEEAQPSIADFIWIYSTDETSN